MAQTSANGHVTRFEYDELGRRTKRILPDNSTETTAYSATPEVAGSSTNVVQTAVTDFRGKTITTTQDPLGRLKTKVLPAVNAGETSTTVNYVYSDVGLPDRVDMFGNVIRTNYYAYDELRRLVKKDTPEGVLAYGYNTNALETIKGYRRSAVPINGAIPGGTTPDVSLGYGYDALSRLATVTNCALAAPNVTAYRYDNVGNLDSFTYPNGVNHAYAYNGRNRLGLLRVTRGNGTLLHGYGYELGQTGHRIGVRETNVVAGVETFRRRMGYEYDLAHFGAPNPARVYRLTREILLNESGSELSSTRFTYDQVGNRTAADYSQYSFDRRDLIDSDQDPTNANPNYDLNGNTVRDETGNPTGDLYDVENHLIKRGANLQIGYDHEGNRVWKTVNGVTTYYLVDDRNPSGCVQVLAEYSSLSAPPDRAYAYGHDLLSQVLSGAQPSTNYYGYDGHGSVRFLTDNPANPANVAVTDTYDYDAYGVLIGSTGSTANRYRYAGEQWDEDLGMYNNRARYYRAELGRFWTMDSVEGRRSRPLSLHGYLYCYGSPVDFVDPTGHTTQAEVLTTALVYFLLASAAYEAVDTAVRSAKGTLQPMRIARRSRAPDPRPEPKPIPVPFPPSLGNPQKEEEDCPTLYISETLDNMRAIAQHIKDAQLQGPYYAAVPLHCGARTKPFRDANRAAVLSGKGSAGVDPNGEPLEWDEYPFASTAEGGNPATVSTRPVPWREQRVQGGVVKAFYDARGFVGGECFYVQIVP